MIGSTTAVKSGQLCGNADTFIPIFSTDTLDFIPFFSNRYFSRRENDIVFVLT